MPPVAVAAAAPSWEGDSAAVAAAMCSSGCGLRRKGKSNGTVDDRARSSCVTQVLLLF